MSDSVRSLSHGWSKFHLGELTFESQLRAKDIDSSSHPVFGVNNRTGLDKNPKYFAEDLSRYKIIKPGMFAYNPMRLNIGSIGYCKEELGEGLVSPDYVVFGCNDALLNPDYLFHYLKGYQWKSWLMAAGMGSVRIRIYYEELARYSIQIPPIAEQCKIASILTTWDEAIENTERLIAALRIRKKGLMQRLLLVEQQNFSPSHRLENFKDKWQIKHLKDVFSRVTRRNESGCNNILTASAQHGIVSQLDYYSKSVAGKSLSGYYLIKKGEFVYNRGRSTGYPFGAIKRLELYNEGILSNLYICFRIKDEQKDLGEFYDHYFESGILNDGLYRITQEGARNHGLLNISVSDFFNLPIPVPRIKEQHALTNFFNLIDQEIALVKEKLISLQLQKKGLMQRLFTGQVRVKI